MSSTRDVTFTNGAYRWNDQEVKPNTKIFPMICYIPGGGASAPVFTFYVENGGVDIYARYGENKVFSSTVRMALMFVTDV